MFGALWVRVRSSKPELHTGMGFLHLGPRVEASPQPPSTSPKRKRDLSSDSEDDLAELLDPEPVWSVETLCGLKMKLKKQRMSTVRPEYHKVFIKLLGKRRPHSSLLKQKRELAVNPHSFPVEKLPHNPALCHPGGLMFSGLSGTQVAGPQTRADVAPVEVNELGLSSFLCILALTLWSWGVSPTLGQHGHVQSLV